MTSLHNKSCRENCFLRGPCRDDIRKGNIRLILPVKSSSVVVVVVVVVRAVGFELSVQFS
jgi:hypothetical protein